MVWPESTKNTRTSTVRSPPDSSARVTTRYFAPMPCQSVKFGASGFWAGRAASRFSGTNWKSPSNSRSLRSTVCMVPQASVVAGSGFLGTQGGIANRGASPPMMILEISACWAAPGSPEQRRAAERARPALRSRPEDGLDRLSGRVIAPGEGGEGRGGIDGPLGSQVQQRRPARLRDVHLGEAAVREDGEGDGHRLGEAGLDLLVPDHPDLLLHAGQVPVAPGVGSLRNARTRGAEGEAGSGRGRARRLRFRSGGGSPGGLGGRRILVELAPTQLRH